MHIARIYILAALFGASEFSTASASPPLVFALPIYINGNRCPEPILPDQARQAEATGQVDTLMIISKSGTVDRIEVVRSSGPTRDHKSLDRAVLDSLAQCETRFPYASKESGPVKVTYIWQNNGRGLSHQRFDSELVGRKYTYMFNRERCAVPSKREFLASPDATAPVWTTNEPTSFEVIDASGIRRNGSASTYQIKFEGGAGAYLEKSILNSAGEPDEALHENKCVFAGEKALVVSQLDAFEKKRLQAAQQLELTRAQEQREEDERAAKPNVRIGMIPKQVIERTNWGKPTRINRTVSAGQVNAQWVYPGGQYLYFRDGRLHSIQTSSVK